MTSWPERRHAEIENAIRDLKYGVGLNHLPSGRFAANGAWLDFDQSFDDLFVVNVGDVFLVELILQTRAQGLITSGEALANSNFYDSGNFLLSLGDLQGLTLTQIPVPEPGVCIMMAIGLGLMGWAGRRSKPQAAVH